MHDLFKAVELDAECKNAEIMLVASDNGGSYSLDIAFNQHCVGRVWRKHGYAWLCNAAYGPNDSSYNWEIKQ